MGKFTVYRPFDGKAGSDYKLSEHVSIRNHTARLIIDSFNTTGQAWAHTEHAKNIQVIKLYCEANGTPFTIQHKHEGRSNPYFLIKREV